MIRLENDFWRMDLVPEIGASVCALALLHSGQWRDVFRPSPAVPKSASDCASFLMAPYPNRVRDGILCIGGARHQLKNAEKHSIHGDVRNRPWHTRSASPTEAVFELESERFPDFNFPLSLGFEQKFALEGSSVSFTATIRNHSPQLCPVGFGFHPYFQRGLESSENAILSFSAESLVELEAQVPLPTGKFIAVPSEVDFSRGQIVPDGLDHLFASWSGLATITYPKSLVTLEISSDPSLRYLTLYSPRAQSHFALEPISMMTDGARLEVAGVQGTGVQLLGPGDTFSATFRIEAKR